MIEIIVGVVVAIAVAVLVIRMVTKGSRSTVVEEGHPRDRIEKLRKERDADG